LLNFAKFFRWRNFLILSVFGIVFVLLINFIILNSAEKFIFSKITKLPQADAVLVLGALVYSNGNLSTILQDRAEVALKIYQSGKVKNILASGDNGRVEYNEVKALKNFFLKSGVPESDIFLDHAGFDTYDSIFRAKEIFQAQSIIIVTQKFHLPRAVWIARRLGVEAIGFPADQRIYLSARRNAVREVLARIKAFFDVIFHVKPKFLGEKILMN
jgi:SanA protein